MSGPAHIDATTAEAALREAAWPTAGDGGERMIVHSFAHSGPMAIGADADVDDIVAGLATADEIAWIDHPFEHDLAVRHGTQLRFYQVKRPERSRSNG